MQLKAIMDHLRSNSDPSDIKGMERFGIRPDRTFGTKIPVMRALAKEIGKDHTLAQELWEKGYRETMIIASLVEEPNMVTEKQMEEWASQFTYWEICDQVVMNLFGRIELGWKKAHDWSTHEHEGTKRAAFVIMARLAVGDKKAEDKLFEEFLPLIEREAADERNDVKKGVNWALRQIGKRNLALNIKAITAAKRIHKIDSKTAKWVAADALRELESVKIQKRLEKGR